MRVATRGGRGRKKAPALAQRPGPDRKAGIARRTYLDRPTAFMTSPMPLLPASMNEPYCSGGM